MLSSAIFFQTSIQSEVFMHVLKRLPIGRLMLVLTASLLVLGTLTGSPALAKDTLTLAVKGEPDDGYDPTLGWGRYGSPLFQSTLLKRDENLNIVNDLATDLLAFRGRPDLERDHPRRRQIFGQHPSDRRRRGLHLQHGCQIRRQGRPDQPGRGSGHRPVQPSNSASRSATPPSSTGSSAWASCPRLPTARNTPASPSGPAPT